MKTFKEIIKADRRRVFINPAEFGSAHEVDGRQMIVIVDDSEREERDRERGISAFGQGIGAGGMYVEHVLVYALAEDFNGIRPRIGRQMSLDSRRYLVSDVVDEGGIFAITLEGNQH